jgi:YD repeat-containing protein
LLEYYPPENVTLNHLQDSDGHCTDYYYDAVGRLAGIGTPSFDYVGFDYDAGGRVKEKWFTNGVDARYAYNADNTLATLTNVAGATAVSSHSYTYDPQGSRKTQAETVAGTTLNFTYGYDELNCLTLVQNGTVTQQEAYSYDPIGERLTKSVGTTSPTVTAYVYDAANQLKEIYAGSATGSYCQ